MNIDADKLKEWVEENTRETLNGKVLWVDAEELDAKINTLQKEQPPAGDSQWREKNGAEYFGYREAGVYEERSTQRIIKRDGQAPTVESVRTEWRRIDSIPAPESDVCPDCGGRTSGDYHNYYAHTGKKPDEVEAVLDELFESIESAQESIVMGKYPKYSIKNIKRLAEEIRERRIAKGGNDE